MSQVTRFFSNFPQLKQLNKIKNTRECNGTWTHNHLVPKWTLNHLAKLAKWLSCVVSTYLYDAFDCMFLSYHVHISEWTHTL